MRISRALTLVGVPFLAIAAAVWIWRAGPRHPRVLLIGVDGADPGIFDRLIQEHSQSTNGLGAATWTDFSGDFPDLPANAIAIDVRTRAIYVGTDVGAFETFDGGAHWRQLTRGVPNVVSGNTNAASIMIGEKAAEMLAADYGVNSENSWGRARLRLA